MVGRTATFLPVDDQESKEGYLINQDLQSLKAPSDLIYIDRHSEHASTTWRPSRSGGEGRNG